MSVLIGSMVIASLNTAVAIEEVDVYNDWLSNRSKEHHDFCYKSDLTNLTPKLPHPRRQNEIRCSFKNNRWGGYHICADGLVTCEYLADCCRSDTQLTTCLRVCGGPRGESDRHCEFYSCHCKQKTNFRDRLPLYCSSSELGWFQNYTESRYPQPGPFTLKVDNSRRTASNGNSNFGPVNSPIPGNAIGNIRGNMDSVGNTGKQNGNPNSPTAGNNNNNGNPAPPTRQKAITGNSGCASSFCQRLRWW